MNGTWTRDAVKTARTTRMGLLSEPAGYVSGANLFEFVGSNPIDRADPLGLTGAATQPTTQPGRGEGWVDPANPGAGIYRNADNPTGANCLGRACGQKNSLLWNYDDKYVPKGCEPIPCDKLPEKNDCKSDEVIIIVSIFRDKNNPNSKGFHVVYRNANTPDGQWEAKLGGDPASDRADNLQNSGADVRAITDVDAHLNWYWNGLKVPGENPEVSRRCFRCNKSQMRPNSTGTSLQGK